MAQEQPSEGDQDCKAKRSKSNNNDNTCSILHLPEEMILKVCKYLPLEDLHSVALASPRLMRVAEDHSLRRNVHLDLWKGNQVFFSLMQLSFPIETTLSRSLYKVSRIRHRPKQK